MQPVPVKKHNLNKLQQWLNYELSGSAIFLLHFLGFSSFLIPMGVAMLGIIILVPLLMKVLFQQKRYGWITSFFIFVLAPPIAIYLLVGNWYWTSISLLFSIACFYIYCAALKLVIWEWMDYEWIKKEPNFHQ